MRWFFHEYIIAYHISLHCCYVTQHNRNPIANTLNSHGLRSSSSHLITTYPLSLEQQKCTHCNIIGWFDDVYLSLKMVLVNYKEESIVMGTANGFFFAITVVWRRSRFRNLLYFSLFCDSKADVYRKNIFFSTKNFMKEIWLRNFFAKKEEEENNNLI